MVGRLFVIWGTWRSRSWCRIGIRDGSGPHAICVEGEDEALISRELAGLMGVEESYSRSAWRFEDDPPGMYRPEARPQYWAGGEQRS